MSMTFEEFRQANVKRCNMWHSDRPGDLGFWGLCLSGEVGEACNIIKKIICKSRGIMGYEQRKNLKEALAEELADSMAYLFLVADKAGIDLEEASIAKFNKVSRKHGFSVFLPEKEI